MESFEIISNRIRPKLLTIAKRFSEACGLIDEAEDVVQESLVTLWRLSEDGYPIRDAEALAVKIAKNNCVAHFRRNKIKTQSMTDYDFVGGALASSIVDDADTKAIAESLYGNLTDTQRKYLKLRNEEGLSLDEIASMTGNPKSSIKTSISVARKQMLELLKRQL